MNHVSVMKRIFAPFLLLLFTFAMTDAFAIADYLTRDLKCPKCKMKIENKGACPCCLKKKPPKTAIIHDPCADEEGDLTLHFDRLSAVLISVTHFIPVYTAILSVSADSHLVGTFTDIPYPPPRD
jgi:hypothetical protein